MVARHSPADFDQESTEQHRISQTGKISKHDRSHRKLPKEAGFSSKLLKALKSAMDSRATCKKFLAKPG